MDAQIQLRIAEAIAQPGDLSVPEAGGGVFANLARNVQHCVCFLLAVLQRQAEGIRDQAAAHRDQCCEHPDLDSANDPGPVGVYAARPPGTSNRQQHVGGSGGAMSGLREGSVLPGAGIRDSERKDGGVVAFAVYQPGPARSGHWTAQVCQEYPLDRAQHVVARKAAAVGGCAQ